MCPFRQSPPSTHLETGRFAAMRTFVTRSQARQLLHNKFVAVLGGSGEIHVIFITVFVSVEIDIVRLCLKDLNPVLSVV